MEPLPEILANSSVFTGEREFASVFQKAGRRGEPYLLRMINTDDKKLQPLVEAALKSLGTDEKKIRAQTIKDLSHSKDYIARRAMVRLKSFKPNPAMAEEISQAGSILVKKLDDRFLRTNALDTLEAGWVSKDQLPELLQRLQTSTFEGNQIIPIIKILRDPSSYEPLAVFLVNNPQGERGVREALISFGPPAEDAAMKLVGSKNFVANRSGLQILAEIGGKKSLNALTNAAPTLVKLDPGCRVQLATTIARIKEREKK